MQHTKDWANMFDCTGCRNTQVLFQLTEILWDYKFCRMSQDVGKLRCRIAQVTLYCKLDILLLQGIAVWTSAKDCLTKM